MAERFHVRPAQANEEHDHRNDTGERKDGGRKENREGAAGRSEHRGNRVGAKGGWGIREGERRRTVS